MGKVIKIAVIVPSALPIPSVRGGAIETLLDYLIYKNETKQSLDISVYCEYDAQAKQKSLSLCHTKVYYYRGESLPARVYSHVRNIRRKICPRKGWFSSYPLWQMTRDISRENFDFVIIEGNAQVAEYVKRRVNKPLIVHLHNELSTETKRAMEIVGATDYFFTVSDYIGRQVKCIRGCDAERVFTIHNCVDLQVFDLVKVQGVRQQIRNSLGILPEDILVLFSGRFTPEKGLLELIYAIEQLPENVKLLCLGTPSFEDGMETEYSHKVSHEIQRFSQKIICPGMIPHNQVPKYAGAADIAVVPSIWNEPAALAVFEALAMGLPLILTDSGGIIEYRNDNCSILIHREKKMLVDEIKTAIMTLCTDDRLRESMSLAAQDFIRHYDTENYYSEYVSRLNVLKSEMLI